MPSVIIHIYNEEAVLGDIEELPSGSDNVITVNHPRRRDGKDLEYLDASVTRVIWPISRINYIEVMPGEQEEEIITFVRE